MSHMSFLNDPSSAVYARAAGLGYLTIALAGGFSIAFMPNVVFNSGLAPLDGILQHRGLFLAGIAGDTVVMLAEILVTAMLFFMFRPVNPTLSMIAALARFAMVAVMAAMLLFYAGLVVLSDSPVFQGRGDLAALLLAIHDSGVWIWQVFFTAHLFALGVLVVQSGRYPRLLGWGLALGGLGYLLDSAYAFAFPDVELLGYTRAALLAVVTLSEISFALWLTFRGPRDERRPLPVGVTG